MVDSGPRVGQMDLLLECCMFPFHLKQVKNSSTSR